MLIFISMKAFRNGFLVVIIIIDNSDKFMTDKRHIAIVLAVGLLLAMSCVMGQRAINPQIGLQTERLSGLSLGNLEQQNTQFMRDNPLIGISEPSKIPEQLIEKPIIEESPIQDSQQAGKVSSTISGHSDHPGIVSMAVDPDIVGSSYFDEVSVNWNGVSPKIASYNIDHYVSGESPKYLANIAYFEAGGKIVGHIAFINDDICGQTYYSEVLELSEINE